MKPMLITILSLYMSVLSLPGCHLDKIAFPNPTDSESGQTRTLYVSLPQLGQNIAVHSSRKSEFGPMG